MITPTSSASCSAEPVSGAAGAGPKRYNRFMRSIVRLPAIGLLVIGVAACSNSPSQGTPAPAAGTDSPSAAAAAPQGAPAQAPAPAAARDGNTFSGTIAEAMNAGDYTYARLQGSSKEIWIAATKFDAQVGTPVTVALELPMENFESKTLKRTFPVLYFVSEVAMNGAPLRGVSATGAPMLMTGHGSGSATTPAPARGPVTVEKIAPPPGGLSVADVIAKGAQLSGKTVTVSGTVVKFNGGIMDRNWLHIQDGSGAESAGTHDLTVTTTDTVQVGEVVTISGVVGTKKDFGAGYAYDTIVEKATVSRR